MHTIKVAFGPKKKAQDPKVMNSLLFYSGDMMCPQHRDKMNAEPPREVIDEEAIIIAAPSVMTYKMTG